MKSEHCRMAWAFEKVASYELKNYEKKSIKATSKENCLEQCVLEQDFQCRSVNYNNQTQQCSMSHLDRHSVPSSNLRGIFTPAEGSNVDYYETNCIKGKLSFCCVSHLLTKQKIEIEIEIANFEKMTKLKL